MASAEATETVLTENGVEEGFESEDFGSFSDASFENESDDQDEVAGYLEELLPSSTCGPLRADTAVVGVGLVGLLQDERPRVIYEQLVQLPTVLQPFNWNKSHLKSDLWHILRLPEEVQVAKPSVRGASLDDSLYKKLRALLEEGRIETTTVLRDQFKFDYSVPLAPGSLQFEDEDEIPELLTRSKEDIDWPKYHDQLCNAVDDLFSKLRKLREQHASLLSDKNTFETVVTNLTGHTQRHYRNEVALYNKKIKKRNKFSWGR